MPTIDAHDPGTICWIDLASTDADGATEFYCELFGWTATEPIEDAGGYRMLLHDGRQVAGLAPVLGRHRSLGLVDLRRERGRRRDLRGGDRERRRGRDGRDGRARRRPHGDPARPGRRAGLGLAARRAPRLRGARRARRADLERAHDAATLRRPRRSTARSSAGRRSRQDFDGVAYTVWKRGDQLVGGALEMDETWPEDTQPHWMVYDRDSRLRRHRAPLRRARRHGAAAADRHRRRARCALLEDPAGAAFSVITLRP